MTAVSLVFSIAYFANPHRHSFYCLQGWESQSSKLTSEDGNADISLPLGVTLWPRGSSFKNSFCLPLAIIITDTISILTVHKNNQSSVFGSSSSVPELLLCKSLWYMSALPAGVFIKSVYFRPPLHGTEKVAIKRMPVHTILPLLKAIIPGDL